MQLGQETTGLAGTAVAADLIWRGYGLLEDLTEVHFVDEEVGYVSGTDRAYIPFVAGKVSMPDVEATFEQFPHILEASLGHATPGQDGTGSGYVYSYAFPTTTLPTIRPYTIEGGDNQQAEELAYCFVQDFKLSGAPKEAVMMSANWYGRQISNTTFTTGLSLQTVEEILFTKAVLYIDEDSGTIGTTPVSATLLGFTFNANTGLIPKHTADGNLYFTFPQNTMPEVTLDLTYEHNATAVLQKTAWRANTPKQVRLDITGSDLSSTGTAYDAKHLIIDLAGKYEKFTPLGELDGNDTIDCTFRGRYNASADLFCELVVVNELSALP